MAGKEYPNFYETLVEANARLGRTIVLYNGLPYFVEAIAETSGPVFDIYLSSVGEIDKEVSRLIYGIIVKFPIGHSGLVTSLDEILSVVNDETFIRTKMNDRGFNFFRPFPLGMCNMDGKTLYFERQPLRPRMEQGLIPNGILRTPINIGTNIVNTKKVANPNNASDALSLEFRDCILGNHPSFQEVIDNLGDPENDNDACAFHREFALVKGPVETLFLAYRTDIIGNLPDFSASHVVIHNDFNYCEDVVRELGLFHRVSFRG